MNNIERNELFKDILQAEYQVFRACGASEDQLGEVERVLSNAAISRRQLRSAIRQLSDDRNTVCFDDAGLPSVMVRVPVSGMQRQFVWVGKYLCSLCEGSACSLPLRQPIHGVDFDMALHLCRQKGNGWTLTPFALRMQIAQACRAAGFLPDGNNDRGHDYFHPDQKGTPTGTGTVLCGSGPVEWAHDGTPCGLWDMNGNLNEWDAGFRLLEGEIQLIPMEQQLQPQADMSADSPLWRAMNEHGELVAPGSEDTLKYDAMGEGVRLTRQVEHPGVGNSAFAAIQEQENLLVPPLAVALGLYPEATRQGYGHGWRWISTQGECLPLCGGAYRAIDHAGVFFAGITHPRTMDYELIGFRTVFTGEEDEG